MDEITTPGWEHAVKNADQILWLPGDVPMMFQRIPAGEFLMGSRGVFSREEPQHQVVIPEPFYMATFHVTQHQWRAVAESTGSKHNPDPSHFKGILLPVENVSWDDTVAWCALLNHLLLEPLAVIAARENWNSCETAIPTEAHWEYACRAGTETEFHTGDGSVALDRAGWFRENSESKTHSVGLRQPNDFGLYDMHGNVWEWCRDKYDSIGYRRRWDGITSNEIWLLDEMHGERAVRVGRGGSWVSSARFCRSAYRFWFLPDFRFGSLGFRVCLFSGPLPGQAESEPRAATTRDEEEPANRDDGAREIFLDRETLPRQ